MQNRHLGKLLIVVLAAALNTVAGAQQSTDLDVVIKGGRVMDPESGLDAVRNVGIRNGTIEAISTMRMAGKTEIDATGLIVAPGFVDLHAHGQDPVSARLQAADGVTTALEMELGVYRMTEWVDSRRRRAIINYGATAGHLPIRLKVLAGTVLTHLELLAPESAPILTGSGLRKEATERQVDEMIELLERDLRDGGLGVGILPGQSPGATRGEILRIYELAARVQVPVYVHLRQEGSGVIGALQEVLANTLVTGAATHVVHINSSAGEEARAALAMLRAARARGCDVTTETYPYTASSTRIESPMMDRYENADDEDYQKLQWADTAERLTRATFRMYRQQGGWVIEHGRSEETNEWIVAQPDVMIASDGVSFAYGPAHPRGAGTYARILGRYVRERGALTLMSALNKTSLLPAQRLERVSAQMKNKGRVRPGADADLVILDAATVIDRATYTQGDIASKGIIHVLVGGVSVVKDAAIVDGVFPGQPILRSR